MMPMTRHEIEVLLDSPDRHDYVVSAYADLSVRNGFERQVEQRLKNQSRTAGELLGGAGARRDLDANLAAVRDALRNVGDPQARGVAVFSGVTRGLRHVVPLDFPVEDRLVIDEEPYVLPLLERWYGEPTFLIVLADSDEAHLFEALHGAPDRVRDLVRDGAGQDVQRDKARFTHKKRFAQTRHERLFGVEDDRFLKEVCGAIRDHWASGHFTGLIVLGQSQIAGAIRRHLSRDIEAAVVGEAQQAMTTRADDLTGGVAAMIERFQADREANFVAQLGHRWKENHRVADGATEVLDALQQGRAERVFLGNRRDIPGAHCNGCNYRLGAPVRTCPYCGAETRTVNAVQDIMKMAVRHKVPVHVLRHAADKGNPLTVHGDVVALLLAEANWAPNRPGAAANGRAAPNLPVS